MRVLSWVLRPLPKLSDRQFWLWQELLERRTGIDLSAYKPILQAGLLKRMRQLGYESYEDYYYRVSSQRGDAVVEWGELLNSLTVQETRFYRDSAAFDFLKTYLRLRLRDIGEESLELWSVGCSSGEEAYSLAITAAEVVRLEPIERLFAVTGTDISSGAIASASAGKYRQQQLREIAAALRYRYFRNTSAGIYQVVPALRSRVCFSRANVALIATLPDMLMDVIYCQNMLIYFKREARMAVLNALYKRLKPGGLLITGPGESQGWELRGVRRIHNSHVEGYIKQ